MSALELTIHQVSRIAVECHINERFAWLNLCITTADRKGSTYETTLFFEDHNKATQLKEAIQKVWPT